MWEPPLCGDESGRTGPSHISKAPTERRGYNHRFFRLCFASGVGVGVGEGVGLGLIIAIGEGVGVGFGFQAMVTSSIRQPFIPLEMVSSRCSVEAA